MNTAAEANRLHSELLGLARTSLEIAIRIGELLTEQKARLKHGEWLPWVKDNIEFSEATAKRYMSVHRRRDELKSLNVSDLSDAYRLLSAPAEDDAPETEAELTPAPTESTDAFEAEPVTNTERELTPAGATNKFICEACQSEFDTTDECQTLYECMGCGSMFTKESSADGCSHRCSGCNRFGSKVSDSGCPACNEGEVMPAENHDDDAPHIRTADEIAALEKLSTDAAETVTLRPEVLPSEPTPHVTHNSGENEWYTPAEYIEAARAAMGSIDLDPASCPKANKTVKAARIYTKDDDGLTQPWAGNVWMNPPYSQSLIAQFSNKISEEFDAGRILQACVLVNNATETAWFQRMMRSASAVCFPRGRIHFIDPSGTPAGAPLQGQAVSYFGEPTKRFERVFGPLGVVTKPLAPREVLR
ncbi:MAG: DNA N-6-adenine-methyltransferase [Verrucomicrobiia bacterium]